jgi:hypothetical protein
MGATTNNTCTSCRQILCQGGFLRGRHRTRRYSHAQPSIRTALFRSGGGLADGRQETCTCKGQRESKGVTDPILARRSSTLPHAKLTKSGSGGFRAPFSAKVAWTSRQRSLSQGGFVVGLVRVTSTIIPCCPPANARVLTLCRSGGGLAEGLDSGASGVTVEDICERGNEKRRELERLIDEKPLALTGSCQDTIALSRSGRGCGLGNDQRKRCDDQNRP